MYRVREEVLDVRDPVTYQLSSRIDDSAPSDCILGKLKADKIQFRLHVPFAEMIKTLTCHSKPGLYLLVLIFLETDTPQLIINNACVKLRLQEHGL